MSKGKRYDPQDKRDAVASFNGMGGTTEAAKEVAADYGVHYTTIQDWAKANGQKPAKRKTSKRSVKARPAKSDEQEWETLFNSYIFHRDEAAKAKKALEEYVEKLR